MDPESEDCGRPKSIFLKWSPPTKAEKEKFDVVSEMRRLTKPTSTMQEKCGELREVLNCIQPPREWFEDGVYWKQEVSNEPATRSEVIALTEVLDKTMIQAKARETGICDAREAIYTDLFDELIRQTAINCIERGLLLLRIREEARSSIKCFQQLYISSLAYGIRKTLESDEDLKVLKVDAEKLNNEKEVLETELENIMYTIEEKEKELAQKMESILSKHKAEIEIEQETHTNLKYQLLGLTSLNKDRT